MPPRKKQKVEAKVKNEPQGNDLTDYEKLRLENIRKNAEELSKLGLNLSLLTNVAAGKLKPSKATRISRAIPPRTRWSSRLLGRPAPDYTGIKINGDLDEDDDEEEMEDLKKTSHSSSKTQRTRTVSTVATAPTNPQSCRNLRCAVSHLKETWLGKIIPPLGGQVKKAAMEQACAEGSPTFSRMSGIQEFKDAVCLFINVYGDGYKNVFLNDGLEVTWFAQNRQWEGTPVIQRMINTAGGVNGEGDQVEPTPVLLFARSKGKGYVYCGQLAYCGHDPERLPIRFVWQLLDVEVLRGCKPFQQLLEDCSNLFE